MQLWCQLVAHTEKQLNILQNSRTNQKKSAFECLCGKQDYNFHPFAILGTSVEVCVMLTKRRTLGSKYKVRFLCRTIMGTLQVP